MPSGSLFSFIHHAPLSPQSFESKVNDISSVTTEVKFSFHLLRPVRHAHPLPNLKKANNEFLVKEDAASSMATSSDQPVLESTDTEKCGATPDGISIDGEKATDSDLPVNNSTREERKQSPVLVDTSPDTEEAPFIDPHIVDWDGPNDPADPMNFSGSIKSINIGIVSGLTFITPLASSMFAPGVPEIMAEFNSTNTLLAGFVVSVYVLGFAIGPLILAPASELYGRAVIYHICNIGFVIFTVACAVSTDLGMLITFRFFQGCFGSAPVTNGTFYPYLSSSAPVTLLY